MIKILPYIPVIGIIWVMCFSLKYIGAKYECPDWNCYVKIGFGNQFLYFFSGLVNSLITLLLAYLILP